ncbi:MAG: epsA [Rhizobacter sp.]|nr:epsA [Rhizobacter sp.]
MAYHRFATAAGEIACSRTFNDWCDGLLRPFIAFERMVCCLGRVTVNGFVVDGVQSIGWPASLVPEPGAVVALSSGCSLDRCFSSGEPQWIAGRPADDREVMLDSTAGPLGPTSAIDAAQPNEAASRRFRSAQHTSCDSRRRSQPAATVAGILVHGTKTSGGQPSSYFTLLAPYEPDSSTQLLKARMVAPYLHQAQVAVSWHRTLERSNVATTALSPKELEVLRWMVAGKTNAEIAAIAHRSKATIKNQVSSLIAKLNVTNRSQAVGVAHELGLVQRRSRIE